MRTLATAVAAVLVAASGAADARPFRAMVTRTALTTDPLNLELGLRYQIFLAGRGLGALPYQQLSPGVRLGLIDGLELQVYADFMVLGLPGVGPLEAYLGDIPLGLQFTFFESSLLAVGVWARGTIPVGVATYERLPSSLADRIIPTVSDGSWDAEGTLIVEIRPTRTFRIMLNAGYLYHGERTRGPDPDFDLPDAIRYDAAATFNLGDRFLLGVELIGRSFLQPQITPAWSNNQHHLEVIPHARLETIPFLVLEAAVGFALTRDLQDIYLIRGLLGFTFETDLLPPERGGGEGRGKKRGRK